MLSGTQYLRNLETEYATVFEALYCIATTVDSWPAAINAMHALAQGGHIGLRNEISYTRTLVQITTPDLDPKLSYLEEIGAERYTKAFTYTTQVRINETSSDACVAGLWDYHHKPELASSLSKFKVIDGTPICGVDAFDNFILTPPEVNTILNGLDGLLLRELFTAIQSEHREQIEYRDSLIQQLKNKISDSEDYDKEMNEKSKGYAGRIILACARQIIGIAPSLRMNDAKITSTLIDRLSESNDEGIASQKGLLSYIKAGMAREKI